MQWFYCILPDKNHTVIANSGFGQVMVHLQELFQLFGLVAPEEISEISNIVPSEVSKSVSEVALSSEEQKRLSMTKILSANGGLHPKTVFYLKNNQTCNILPQHPVSKARGKGKGWWSPRQQEVWLDLIDEYNGKPSRALLHLDLMNQL